MLAACHKSLRCADVIGVVHDVSNKWTKDKLHSDVINMLEVVKDIPKFLILNKVLIIYFFILYSIYIYIYTSLTNHSYIFIYLNT